MCQHAGTNRVHVYSVPHLNFDFVHYYKKQGIFWMSKTFYQIMGEGFWQSPVNHIKSSSHLLILCYSIVAGILLVFIAVGSAYENHLERQQRRRDKAPSRHNNNEEARGGAGDKLASPLDIRQLELTRDRNHHSDSDISTSDSFRGASIEYTTPRMLNWRRLNVRLYV